MDAKKVLEDLKRRFPNEPEYHQAVEEVLATIEEEYNKHPEFDKANLIERLCIPDRVYQFRVTWVIYGASRAKGGKAIIAMPSMTKRGVSKIVPTLTPGASVVTTRFSFYAISSCHSLGKIKTQKNPAIKDWIIENKKMVGVVLIVRKKSLKIKRLQVNGKCSPLR